MAAKSFEEHPISPIVKSWRKMLTVIEKAVETITRNNLLEDKKFHKNLSHMTM